MDQEDPKFEVDDDDDLRLGIPGSVFLTTLPTKILYVFLSFSLPQPCPTMQPCTYSYLYFMYCFIR
jgi:hypothetical protein